MRKTGIIFLFNIIVAVGSIFPVFAATGMDKLKPYIASVQQSEQGMTLWQLVQAGGFVMVVLGFLSILATALIVYNFITLKTSRLIPEKFTLEVINKLERKQKIAAEKMCKTKDNIISKIVMAGLLRRSKGHIFAREAMEDCARKEISNLWQNISYLADVATVAPLVGLLGTVLGMIQAFNVIAFQTVAVKPILLAGGVSKAMVTTAAGLIVAIPAMMFYSFFRGRVQSIVNIIENNTTEIIKLIEDL